MPDHLDAHEDDEFGTDQKRMPFTGHLVELRTRLLVCIITVIVVFFLFFFVFGRQLFHVMTLPLDAAARTLDPPVDPTKIKIALRPVSMFLTSAIVSLLAAVALTMPVLIYELWMFVAPGLKRRERKVIFPILSFGAFFFAAGVAFAYFVVLRFVLRFLLKYTIDYGVAARWNIGDLVKFEAVMLLVFGIAFEMPLVIVGLTRVGIITPEALAKKRRHVIVILFIAGALLTPPDIISQICLAIPMVILFELSIQASKFFRSRRTRRNRWELEAATPHTSPSPPTGPAPGPAPDAAEQTLADVQTQDGADEPYPGHDEDPYAGMDYGEEYGYEQDFEAGEEPSAEEGETGGEAEPAEGAPDGEAEPDHGDEQPEEAKPEPDEKPDTGEKPPSGYTWRDDDVPPDVMMH